MMYKHGLIWLRRDLRLVDNQALNQAAACSQQMSVVFVLDTCILQSLPPTDQRVAFIMDAIRDIHADLVAQGSGLIVVHGDPVVAIPAIVQELGVDAVFFNRDYEPYAVKRDAMVMERVGVPVHTAKDTVIFESNEVLSKTGTTYKVYTPYKNQWLREFSSRPVVPLGELSQPVWASIPEGVTVYSDNWYSRLGFTNRQAFLPGGRKPALARMAQWASRMGGYHTYRDIPSLAHTSMLSPYIRFGCVSIRELVAMAWRYKGDAGADVWLSELIWRDFYQMIVATHPQCDRQSIKPEYVAIPWEGRSEWFEAWCAGQTGYPIVDAAMRQLNTTGLMHNRCRMIVASFLCKTLLVDWRRGEAYFAEKLLDFDFASNNGGWGWASSSGCDAQPYFRIFNPTLQSQKFDPDGHYSRQYCPELAGLNAKQIHAPQGVLAYPEPIVDYADMRQRALVLFSHYVKQTA